METGNREAMDSLHPPFNQRFAPFFLILWSLTGVSDAAVFDALSLEIARSATMLLSFSFASALTIATVSLQIQSKLPLSFHLLSLSILLGFSTLLVAKFADFKTLKPAKLLHCLGFLFLVTAFFIAISIPLPLYFTIISVTVFVVTVALIIYFTIIRKTTSLSLSISDDIEKAIIKSKESVSK